MLVTMHRIAREMCHRLMSETDTNGYMHTHTHTRRRQKTSKENHGNHSLDSATSLGIIHISCLQRHKLDLLVPTLSPSLLLRSVWLCMLCRLALVSSGTPQEMNRDRYIHL